MCGKIATRQLSSSRKEFPQRIESHSIASARHPPKSPGLKSSYYSLSFLDERNMYSCSEVHRNHMAELDQDNPASFLFQEASKTRVRMNDKAFSRNLSSWVFGGANAVQNVWCNYKVAPISIFMAEDIGIPSWFDRCSPTKIVRAPQAVINRMLQAKKNENFAGHFPSPSEYSIFDLRRELSESKEYEKDDFPKRALLLYKIRDPQNIGNLLKSALHFGFALVILVSCTSLCNEKLVRASDGFVYHPSLKILEIAHNSNSLHENIKHLIEKANLIPCFATPNQDEQSVSNFSRRLRSLNSTTDRQAGVILALGSEHHGVDNLLQEWKACNPEFISIQIDDSAMESLNVAHAGSILMHTLRYAPHHARLR